MLEGLLTSTEATLRSAGLTREQLIRRLQTGAIRGRLVGGRWFIEEKSLARFLDGQPEKRTPAAAGR